MFLASVGPGDAMSNLSQWVALVTPPPAWIQASRVDSWLIYGSLFLIGGSILWFFWPFLSSVRHNFVDSHPQGNAATGGARRSAHWVPIYEAVAHVARILKDADAAKCFPRTLNALRQAAADGHLRVRGRKQTGTQSMAFSGIHTDVPNAYWVNSTIGALATDKKHADDTHTNPETAFAWGAQGIEEKNRYADLQVNWNDILRLWPSPNE